MAIDSGRVVAVRSQYLARPGRRAVVVLDLADLRGPAEGTVELPVWLFWHPDRSFDLGEPEAMRWMYENVLREASSATDLTAYLHHDLLVTAWSELNLPKGVRQAWEERHHVLRDMASRAGDASH